MKNYTIALVNPNLVQQTAVAPYALDIIATYLENGGFEADILDLTPCADNWSKAIENYFSKNNPDAVGISFRNWYDVYFPSLFSQPEQGSFIPSHKRIVDEIGKYFNRDMIVSGGAGFSIIPQAMLRRAGLKYGMVGAAETIFPNLLRMLLDGKPVEDLHHVLTSNNNYEGGPAGFYPLRINRRDYVDNKWYYEHGESVGLRSNNACIYGKCCYCTEGFAKGEFFSNSIENVLCEIDQLLEMGIYDIHLNDSEVNLPFVYQKRLAKAIIRQNYPKGLRLWSYMQPVPFDEEFARLWGKAGMKGICFGTDHVDKEMLEAFGKDYDFDDIKRTTEICKDNGIAVMHELLFGLYGESMDTIKRSIDSTFSLEPHVIGTTLGIGIYPSTLLSRDRRIKEAIREGDENRRGEKYGVYCKGIPLEDPTFLVCPEIKIPDAFDELMEFVGESRNRIMIPTLRGTSETDNTLVDGERVKYTRETKKKGTVWYYYPEQFI